MQHNAIQNTVKHLWKINAEKFLLLTEQAYYVLFLWTFLSVHFTDHLQNANLEDSSALTFTKVFAISLKAETIVF